MKIKLLVKKIKYKIIKFLYEYFKKIYIRNINIADNKILQYAHNELIIAGYNKNCTYYIDIIEIISIIKVFVLKMLLLNLIVKRMQNLKIINIKELWQVYMKYLMIFFAYLMM